MICYLHKKRLRRILVVFLAIVIVFTNCVFTPAATAVADTKTNTAKSININNKTKVVPEKSAKTQTKKRTKTRTKRLTNKDIKNGVIKLSNETYDKVTIDNNVGATEIILKNVKIKDTLAMEAGAKYKVRAISSEISKVVALEKASKKTSKIKSFSVDDKPSKASPTFIAEKGTLVVKVDARGNVSIIQADGATIGTVVVNRSSDGSISLNLDGFQGKLVIDADSITDIQIKTKNCAIEETTLKGTSAGQKLTISDDTTGGASSNFGKIKVETSAAVKIDVPVSEVVISGQLKEADVSLEKPVEKVINEGTATKLAISNNVSSIMSKGDELAIKIAAGANVKDVELTGNKASVEVSQGAKIESVVAKGNDAAITGNGTVVDVKVEGNNAKINTPDTKVEVGEKASGTVMNGKELAAGTTVTPAPTQAPSTPSTPSTPPTSLSGSVIEIYNPGKIISGKPVQLTASEDVTWEVYDAFMIYGGTADISATGLLMPHKTGEVRVVARSKTDGTRYGAVDLTITGKKLVRMEPIDPIELTQDEHINSIIDLVASGKLPTKVKLVYETGNGAETEVIEAAISRDYWQGKFDSGIVRSYMLRSYILVPDGYESLGNMQAFVEVKVKVAQSGIKQSIISVDPLSTITLTTDEKCSNLMQVVQKHIIGQNVTLHLSDNSTSELKIIGSFNTPDNQFNGAVPGTYHVTINIPLPEGYQYLCKTFTDPVSMNYSYKYELNLPVTIEVVKAQTYDDKWNVYPIVTQPKFASTTNTATIQAVKLIGMPTTLNCGDTIDLTKYLSVDTASVLASDKRVVWTVIGNTFAQTIDDINGKLLMDYVGKVTIRATSAIDNTKYSEVTVDVLSNKQIVSFEPLTQITITENKNIYNFKSMYQALENQLPMVLKGTTATNEVVNIPIVCWNMMSFNNGKMIIAPNTYLINGYDFKAPYPNLTIDIIELQTDLRTVVVSGSTIQASVLISEDKNATRLDYVMKELYQYENNTYTVPVRVKLQDGSEKELQCKVNNYYWITSNTSTKMYKGVAGSYNLTLGISLPDDYKVISSNPYYDLELTQEVIITVDQSARYDGLFVLKEPTKLDYKEGEMLDLTGISIALNNKYPMEAPYVYIGADQINENGLILRRDFGYGPDIDTSLPLTLDMNGVYIYIYNPMNGTYSFFGPITVTK